MPSLLGAALLALAALSTDPDLAAAEQGFSSGRYDEVLPRLSAALGRHLSTAERQRAYELRASTYAAFDQTVEAVESFRLLLGLTPDFALPARASPKLKQLLEQARPAGPRPGGLAGAAPCPA